MANGIQNASLIESALSSGNQEEMDKAMDEVLEKTGGAARTDMVLKMEEPADCAVRISAPGVPPVVLPLNPDRFIEFWEGKRKDLDKAGNIYLWYAPEQELGLHLEDITEH